MQATDFPFLTEPHKISSTASVRAVFPLSASSVEVVVAATATGLGSIAEESDMKKVGCRSFSGLKTETLLAGIAKKMDMHTS